MSRKKVLLVDDVEPFLEIEKRHFNEDEFQVTLARDGREGLLKVIQERPDLVFLDLFMPRMGGLECCRAIKGDPTLKGIPVVMVTASGYDSDYESCREAGCDHIIPKPITRAKIQGAARSILGLKDRYPDRGKARLLVRYGSSAELALSDYSINLSTGGLFLETDSLLSVGTRIVVDFLLPDDSYNISCSARVAWINSRQFKANPAHEVGMGVQFLDLGLSEMDAIRGYVKNQSLVPTW